MKLLGGGSAFEAWLAFDEITFSPVVVKVLRPSQVEDESSLRGLRREVSALAEVNHPVVVRGLRGAADGERPHVVLENIDGPRLSSLIRRYGRLQELPVPPARDRHRRLAPLLRATSAGRTSTSSPAT